MDFLSDNVFPPFQPPRGPSPSHMPIYIYIMVYPIQLVGIEEIISSLSIVYGIIDPKCFALCYLVNQL